MGLGSTAKKIQKLADRAEQLYKRLNDVYEQVQALRQSLEETSNRVEQLEVENAKQQALIEALAREEGIDVESVLDDVETETADGAGGNAVDEDDTGSGSADSASPTAKDND